MTATLAAILVDEGKVRWNTTIGELFPEWRDGFAEPWKNVTLDLLLTQRSGAPHEPPPALWTAAWQQRGDVESQRRAFVEGLLQLRPEAPPGTTFIYSNQGYTIAGEMLARAAHRPYEELLREKLFKPLGMKSAGFGAPGKAGVFDEPRGHRSEGGVLVPMEPGKDADNPPAITPAGRVHCSLTDFVRYASWHARGPNADVKLMSNDSYAHLHTPGPGQEYACGWVVTDRPWAQGAALTHNGSNTMWFAVMWIAPATQSAYVAVTNCAGPEAEKGCDDAVASLIRKERR
jgi:CubicO group peptidase (beta-lactamase class C family)